MISTSWPLVLSRNNRRFSTVHFPPWLSLYSSWNIHCGSTTIIAHNNIIIHTNVSICKTYVVTLRYTYIPRENNSTCIILNMWECTHPVLLNGDVGEVYKHVIQFTQIGWVLDSAKSTETKSIPVNNRITYMYYTLIIMSCIWYHIQNVLYIHVHVRTCIAYDIGT